MEAIGPREAKLAAAQQALESEQIVLKQAAAKLTQERTALEAERAKLMDVVAYREWLQPRLAEKLVPPIDDFYTEDFDIDPNRGY